MSVKPAAATQPLLTMTARKHWPSPHPHISGTSPLLSEDLSIGLSFQCFDIRTQINGREKCVLLVPKVFQRAGCGKVLAGTEEKGMRPGAPR